MLLFELADRDRRKELGPTTLTMRQASNPNSAMSFDEHDLLEDMDAVNFFLGEKKRFL